jgi:hypothetical protein
VVEDLSSVGVTAEGLVFLVVLVEVINVETVRVIDGTVLFTNTDNLGTVIKKRKWSIIYKIIIFLK